MLDNQENKLPDATENQSNDKQESLKDEVVENSLEENTDDSKTSVEPEIPEAKKESVVLEKIEGIIEKPAEEVTSEVECEQGETTKDIDATKEIEKEIEKPTEEVALEVEAEQVETTKEAETTKEIEKPTEEVALDVEAEQAETTKEAKATEEVEVKDEVELEKSEVETKPEVVEPTASVEEEKKDEVQETSKSAVEATEELETKPQNKESQEAVDAVEKEVAKGSENLHKVSQVPMGDYEALDLASVVTTIEALMVEHPIQAIKKHVDALKKVFNKQFGRLLKEAKTIFLKEGGNTIDFHYENPIQEKYNKTLFEYKKRLKAYYSEIEKKYDGNLLLKRNLIEELKELIDNGEANSMYKHFNEIQKQWREIGPVAREHYSDLWRTYHFHVERFYDLLHLRNDLRDLDFKHNLDEKLKLIAKVEVLAESENITEAFNELQEIHRLWKEEIGPVSRESREEVWERFSAATKKIHDKRHNFFDSLKEEFKENLTKKNIVIEEIANYDTSENKRHNDWQRSIKDINDLREKFFKVGKVPRSKNNQIWEKFKEATKVFNKKKNNFYKEIKQEQDANLDRKMKLVEQAESLRESEDWDSVTEVMKKIQSEWKMIGHVPRKHSDKIWNRFKEACNHYFDRLHAKQDVVNEEKFEVYAQKKKFLDDLKTSVGKEGVTPDLKQLKGYIKEWNEMGSVPLKQRYINGKFNKFLDECFGKLSLDIKESTMIRYQNMISNLVEQKDFRKLENEIQFVRKKLEEVTKEKQQLENNMQFFSNADESNPMIKNILKTISQHEKELSIWEAKLRYLRTISV